MQESERQDGTLGTWNFQLGTAFVRAAAWLAFVAPVRGAETPFAAPIPYPHGDYVGATRTEYDTKARRWSLNGPVWHTGQAIRAMLVAGRRLGDDRYREAAVRSGEFMLREQRDDGLLLSFEDRADRVNVQVTFEAISGLLDLHTATGDDRYLTAARRATDFILDGGWLPDASLIRDHYTLDPPAFVGDAENKLPGRAMLDDATLLRLADATGDDRYRDMFIAMARRILREEGPPGTWLQFPPWEPAVGRIHARKSWWWGWPLLGAYDATGEQPFMDAAVRAGDYYLRTANLDGGHYYTPNPEGRHNSYGVCVSVAACAGLLWHDLWRRTGDDVKYLPAIRRSVGFLLAAQFADDVEDANVRGALFESLNVPDGSLAPGFRVRDIAAIFALRLWDAALDTPELLAGNDPWLDTTMKW